MSMLVSWVGFWSSSAKASAHRVFDPVTPPDAGAEATVAFRQHEVLLRPWPTVR